MSDFIYRAQGDITRFPHLKLMSSIYTQASVQRGKAQAISLQIKWELDAQVTWVLGARYFHRCSQGRPLFCQQSHFIILLGNVIKIYKIFQKKCLDSLVNIATISHVCGLYPKVCVYQNKVQWIDIVLYYFSFLLSLLQLPRHRFVYPHVYIFMFDVVFVAQKHHTHVLMMISLHAL